MGGYIKKDYLLSIIIPVYNSEKYISPCLDSLLEQDLDKDEYQIICINDGSTDDSLRILNTYAKLHDNILVIDKPNSGVSATRNMGLSVACAEYVWLVDSDDWIARNCLGTIARELKTHRPSALQVHFDWIKAEWRVKKCAKAVLDKNKTTCGVHGTSVLPYYGAWSSIIKKELLDRYEHAFIEGLHYGEDILFVRELYDRMRMETDNRKYNHKIVHCQGEIFYYYRMHDESAMHHSWTKNRAKYMDALLQLAHINQERMHDTSKPAWYRDQYTLLFYNRMHTYMVYWLPAEEGDLRIHLARLKSEGLYLCPKPTKKIYRELIKSDGILGKIKHLYAYTAFRWSWLYPLYYKQMKKKYQKTARLTSVG